MADLALRALAWAAATWWPITAVACAIIAAFAARSLAELAAEMDASHRSSAASTYRISYAVVIGLALLCVRLAW